MRWLHRFLCCWQLSAWLVLYADHTDVCYMQCGSVPGCGRRADGVQGVWVEYVPECDWPERLHQLHFGMQRWSAANRHLHADNHWRVHSVLEWHLHGREWDQCAVQVVHHQLQCGPIHCWCLQRDSDTPVFHVWDQSVSGRGRRANSLQDLHAELQCRPVPQRPVQRHDDGLVRWLRCRRVPGCGRQ